MSKEKIVYLNSLEIARLEQLLKENFIEIVNSRVKDVLNESICPFVTAFDI